jgi:hypothetical protein
MCPFRSLRKVDLSLVFSIAFAFYFVGPAVNIIRVRLDLSKPPEPDSGQSLDPNEYTPRWEAPPQSQTVPPAKKPTLNKRSRHAASSLCAIIYSMD